MYTLIKEALYVAVVMAILGSIISYCMMLWNKSGKIYDIGHWQYIISSFFITGFVFHLISEYTGVNAYYCIHGTACKNINIKS